MTDLKSTPILNPDIENYLQGLLQPSDEFILLEMEAYATANNFPIVGRLVGKFIETQAKMINAKKVFEFGSGFGYSAYWFAKAVGLTGQITCTDADFLNQQKAEHYLKEAHLWERVNFRSGMAQDIFVQTDELYDICYNDVDKGDYPDVWLMAKERIRPGGLYIADNVLWRGRVAVKNPSDNFPGWTEAIMEHNKLIFNDPEFDAFINPIRDGVIVARKKTL